MSKIKCLLFMLIYSILIFPLYFVFTLLNCIYGYIRIITSFIGVIAIFFGVMKYQTEYNVTLVIMGGTSLLLGLLIIPNLFKGIKIALQKLFVHFYFYKSCLKTKKANISYNPETNQNCPNSNSGDYQNKQEQTSTNYNTENNKTQYEDKVKPDIKIVKQETDFFIGTSSADTIKKRYKELVKIYHTDVPCGNTETISVINRQYEEKLKKVED